MRRNNKRWTETNFEDSREQMTTGRYRAIPVVTHITLTLQSVHNLHLIALLGPKLAQRTIRPPVTADEHRTGSGTLGSLDWSHDCFEGEMDPDRDPKNVIRTENREDSR